MHNELLGRSVDTCSTENDYNGEQNLRILAVFIVMISSGLGAYFPILSSQYSFIRLPNWCFFVANFFGSGVIIATAFIHLLQPAAEALTDDCLGGTFEDYPWAFGICLMSLFMLFLAEIVAHHFVDKKFNHSHAETDNANALPDIILKDIQISTDDLSEGMLNCAGHQDSLQDSKKIETGVSTNLKRVDDSGFEGQYEYKRESTDETWIDENTLTTGNSEHKFSADYGSKVFVLCVLEFGIIFHSVFVGLSLAVAGSEFKVLFIVITFHQMFEGLGLGTRIAETEWPPSKWYTPWIMAFAFTITSPIAIAIGIGVRHSWVPGSRKALIANGVFDSISSGILIYTGLIELMAHEFIFSNQFKGEHSLRNMLTAYFIMCCGAALMALLGRWA